MKVSFNSSVRGIICLIILLSFSFFQSGAQDNNYRSQQYGAAGTLLGGSVIAGVEDNAILSEHSNAILPGYTYYFSRTSE